jgi:hypothetical protein
MELADPRTSVLSRSSKTPDAPPVLGEAPCPLLALPASKRRALTLDREVRPVTRQDRGSLPRLNKLDYGLPEGFGERLRPRTVATLH